MGGDEDEGRREKEAKSEGKRNDGEREREEREEGGEKIHATE